MPGLPGGGDRASLSPRQLGMTGSGEGERHAPMTRPHSDETQDSLGIADSGADGPADAYEGLSPTGRLAAQAYGVVSPHDLGRRNMATLLYHARFALQGRAFTQTEFMAATKEVHEAGIVYRPGPNTGLSAVPAWAPRLTIAAFRGGQPGADRAAVHAGGRRTVSARIRGRGTSCGSAATRSRAASTRSPTIWTNRSTGIGAGSPTPGRGS